jgi:hypothetical protein
MRTTLTVVTVAVLALLATTAFAADILTMPTANQLKAGEVDVAAYVLNLDHVVGPCGPIEEVKAQTLYVGITDWLEVDAHRYDYDTPGMETDTIVNATICLRREDATGPDVVVGVRDIAGHMGGAPGIAPRPSYHISMARTVNPPVGGPPKGPIFRVHASVGTEDVTLLGEKRHEGAFGGLQILARPQYPQLGLIALYDGKDTITGVTITPKGWPTIKGGTFGRHSWVGLNYTFNLF